MWYGGPGAYGWGWHMMGGGFGMLFMLLLVVVVVALLFGAVRSHGRCGRWHGHGYGHGCPYMRSGGGGSSTARDILDQRYARGEIDADEYKRRRADLES